MKTQTLDGFDLAAAEFWGRPQAERYKAYAALRRHPSWPLHREPPVPGLPPGRGFYAVARHDDVVAVSRDPKTWCSGGGAFTIQDLPPQLLEYLGSMIVMDDPRHARFRRIVNRAFTPRRLDDSLPWVRQIAAELVDDITAISSPFDFVAKVAAPFPLRIICRMMGVPWQHGDEILRLTMLPPQPREEERPSPAGLASIALSGCLYNYRHR